MNSLKKLIPLILVASLWLVGCERKQGQGGVHTAPFEKSFSAAEPAVKTTVDQALAAFKSGDYSGAIVDLQALSQDEKLSPEQRQASHDLLMAIRTAFADKLPAAPQNPPPPPPQ